MNYQTLLTQATEWVFSDPMRIGFVIGTILVIGAIKGIARTIGHCHVIGRGGMRVL
jgi:hypothetical protein